MSQNEKKTFTILLNRLSLNDFEGNIDHAIKLLSDIKSKNENSYIKVFIEEDKLFGEWPHLAIYGENEEIVEKEYQEYLRLKRKYEDIKGE